MVILQYDNVEIKVTNPDKYFWPELKITKLDYIQYLVKLAPYFLKYTHDHPITVIRYPHGFSGKSFFQKNIPTYTPEWVNTLAMDDKIYIHLDSIPTLAWLGSQAALEFHTPFNDYQHPDHPSSLVFDLDPSAGQDFSHVSQAALLVYEVLSSLNIKSFIKTSGASGLQVYIPIGRQYTYDEARKINHFFATYFSTKYPKQFTMERSIKKRGKKLYFDYLQMWHGKTIITPYSPRAVESANVATPITWEELKSGCHPSDFNLINIHDRLDSKDDLLDSLHSNQTQNLSFIFEKIER